MKIEIGKIITKICDHEISKSEAIEMLLLLKTTVKNSWCQNNLNADKFRNGDDIPHANTPELWKKAGKDGTPAWCYYDNNPANGEKYGKLYNWYAVNDPRGLAPEGEHIPTDQEFDEMECVPNPLLGGYSWAGSFSSVGYIAYLWSATESGTTAWYRNLHYTMPSVSRYTFDKGNGFSVRCVKD